MLRYVVSVKNSIAIFFMSIPTIGTSIPNDTTKKLENKVV